MFLYNFINAAKVGSFAYIGVIVDPRPLGMLSSLILPRLLYEPLKALSPFTQTLLAKLPYLLPFKFSIEFIVCFGILKKILGFCL